MDDSLFKGYGKDDAVKKAGDALGSVLNQERTSTLTRLTTEISLWAIKEQVRMQQELRWLQLMQKKAGLTAVQADTSAKTAASLAGKVNDFYKELK